MSAQEEYHHVKIMTFIITLLALLTVVPGNGESQSAASGLFQQANQAYQDGNYGEAIILYRQILESGVINGAIYYNLGNAYFKDNQLGQAILSYERARRILPRDRDVVANLALANELTVDKLVASDESFIARLLAWPARTLNIAELTWITFILYLLTSALVMITVWSRTVGARKKVLVITLILAILMLISGTSLMGNIYQQRRVSHAIILSPSTDARSGPGPEYTMIFSVHQGTKIRIRQAREDWYLISLPNGLAGWVPEEVAEKI
jgi:tetratricopeptide (TPR) repeat protein